MMRLVNALLERRSTVYVASAASLALGLFFIFVWTPLPWGWKGIDGYDAISLALANGAPFPTVHLVWGYAYFLAAFYWLFGNHPGVPLTAQALLNATIPLMLYHIVRVEMTERIAVMAALLAGFLSFNTVYASTQASDAVCTVLVVAAMLYFQRGERQARPAYFAVAGLLAAAAYQFRPNLVLFPAFIAGCYLLFRSQWRARLTQMGVFLAVFAIGGLPWVVRNYRWTGLFIPASTHGGVQLWFGTLQTGPYRESWLYNPRAAFEFPPVDYTSIDEMPLVVSMKVPACDAERRQAIDVVYWTNRDRTPRRIAAAPVAAGDFSVTLPAQPSPTAVYYYVDTTVRAAERVTHVQTPERGASDPLMTVESRDHLGDLDIDGHALDVYDVARMLQHLAWKEPLKDDDRLDLDGDGRVTEADVRRAASLIVAERSDPASVADTTAGIASDESGASLRFRDGSRMTVPRRWSGKITDLQLETPVVGSSAAMLVSHSRSFANTRPQNTATNGQAPAADPCMTMSAVRLNGVPYRRYPHELRRFMALAWDNIRHDPWAYLTASAARAVRVFIIAGSEDVRTAYQFSGAGRVYAIGRAISLVLLALLAAGVWIARARGFRLLLLLAPIAYVPLTICFMLINARYSMTMQPFVFAFVAVSLVTAIDALTPSTETAARSR
jgi:hypothetical protein